MALRASVQVKAPSAKPQRRVAAKAVRPVAALNGKAAGAAAAVAVATVAACAPAQAFDLVATVASAAEGYPFVPPSWAPSVLVPITGLLLPAITMATLFVYIEKEA